jgi:hypothetical protein
MKNKNGSRSNPEQNEQSSWKQSLPVFLFFQALGTKKGLTCRSKEFLKGESSWKIEMSKIVKEVCTRSSAGKFRW